MKLLHFIYQNHGVRAKNVGVHGYGLHQALYNIEQGLTSQSLTGINILLTAPWHALKVLVNQLMLVGPQNMK